MTMETKQAPVFSAPVARRSPRIRHGMALFAALCLLSVTATEAYAVCTCATASQLHTRTRTNVKNFIDEQFDKHKTFLVDKFWKEKLQPAFMKFTQQEVSSGQQATTTRASIADGKAANNLGHAASEDQAEQAEILTPDPQACAVASGARSLAVGQAKAQEVATGIVKDSSNRRLGRAELTTEDPAQVDRDERREVFNEHFCDPEAWGGAFKDQCSTAGDLKDRDIDFRKTLDEPWTLDIRPDYADQDADSWTDDEISVSALRQHLFGHEVYPRPTRDEFKQYNVKVGYLNQRALEAKRSVAEYSLQTLIGEKSAASPEAKEWLEASLKNLGIEIDAETQAKIKDKPSYFAIMEVLTKRMYQDPNFYNQLIKPGPQVAQTQASLQAVNLMQMRDVYDSMLRSELILSLIVEMELDDQQAVVQSQTNQ